MTIESSSPRSFTRFFPAIARVLMGLIFFVFGLNGFLNFIPQPKEAIPEGAMALLGAFIKSGYLLHLVAGTEAVCGALLLLNRFVPLALAMIAPVIVNIMLFHIYLAPSGMGVAIFVLVLELYLAWSYRNAFIPMLEARNSTGAK